MTYRNVFLVCCLTFAGRITVSAQEGRLISPNAIAVDPGTHRVYVVDSSRDRVIVEDEASGETTAIPVGKDPEAVAIDESLHRVYVVNSDSQSVSVIDSAANRLVATVSAGKSPYAIGVDSREHIVFVTSIFEDSATVIYGQTNVSKRIELSRKDSVAVDPRSQRVYFLSYENPQVAVLDERSLTVRRILGPLHAWAMATGEDADRIYITILGDNALEIFDTNNGAFTRIATGRAPCAVVLGSKGTFAYVANRDDGTVTVIDTVNQKRVTTLRVGKGPQALLLDPLRNRIYVANTHSNSVTIIDGSANRVLGSVPAGEGPYALGIDSLRGEVYTANYGASPYHRLRPYVSRH